MQQELLDGNQKERAAFLKKRVNQKY